MNNYNKRDLHEIATSILLKYRDELTFRRDKALNFDIYTLNTENNSYSVYIGEESIMLVAYENAPYKQTFSLGVSTKLDIDEVNSAFDKFEEYIKQTIMR